MNPETGVFVYEFIKSFDILSNSHKKRLIIDADALNHISSRIHILNDLPAPAVLTPHPGEMARLTGMSVREVQSDRIGVARNFSKEYNKKVKYIEVEALNYLMNYYWKGNVRELRNVIERSVLMADEKDELLFKEYLPKEITGLDSMEEIEDKNEKTLADYEKLIIENTLRRYGGNKTKTAEVLGIKRQTLYNKLKEYNI